MTNDNSTPTERISLGSLASYEAGTLHIHHTALGPVLLFAPKKGAWRAYDHRCPHAGATLSMGECIQHSIFCPLHQWEFDLVSGQNQRANLPGLTPLTLTQEGTEWFVDYRLS